MVALNHDDIPDPAALEAVEKLLTGEDALTISQLVDAIHSRLGRIDVCDNQAILDIKPLIDVSTALVFLIRDADLRTRNEAAKVKIMAERAAGKWITLHPESLD